LSKKGIKLSIPAILAIIFFILTILMLFLYIHSEKEFDEVKKNYDPDESKYKDAKSTLNGSRIVTYALSFITLVFVFFSCAYTVPVRNVGIVTSFNAPTGRVTKSGLKFVWPWQRVADFDASVQTSDHTTDKNCTTVRIGSLATACVENRIQWQVLDASAPRLYNDYKGDFNNMKQNLVETKIQNALNAVFSTYNPLSQVNLQTGQVGFDGAALGKSVEDELRRTIGNDVRIISVSVPLVHHDAKTEENIKQFQDVIAQSRILDQKKSNAEKEKLVSDLQRAFLTPEYLQNKCIEESVKLGYAPGLCLMNSGIVNVPTTK
jgi:regulator of protease activity HflC (stomatin/prohibitin superfamily)